MSSISLFTKVKDIIKTLDSINEGIESQQSAADKILFNLSTNFANCIDINHVDNIFTTQNENAYLNDKSFYAKVWKVLFRLAKAISFLCYSIDDALSENAKRALDQQKIRKNPTATMNTLIKKDNYSIAFGGNKKLMRYLQSNKDFLDTLNVIEPGSVGITESISWFTNSYGRYKTVIPMVYFGHLFFGNYNFLHIVDDKYPYCKQNVFRSLLKKYSSAMQVEVHCLQKRKKMTKLVNMYRNQMTKKTLDVSRMASGEINNVRQKITDFIENGMEEKTAKKCRVKQVIRKNKNDMVDIQKRVADSDDDKCQWEADYDIIDITQMNDDYSIIKKYLHMIFIKASCFILNQCAMNNVIFTNSEVKKNELFILYCVDDIDKDDAMNCILNVAEKNKVEKLFKELQEKLDNVIVDASNDKITQIKYLLENLSGTCSICQCMDVKKVNVEQFDNYHKYISPDYRAFVKSPEHFKKQMSLLGAQPKLLIIKQLLSLVQKVPPLIPPYPLITNLQSCAITNKKALHFFHKKLIDNNLTSDFTTLEDLTNKYFSLRQIAIASDNM